MTIPLAGRTWPCLSSWIVGIVGWRLVKPRVSFWPLLCSGRYSNTEDRWVLSGLAAPPARRRRTGGGGVRDYRICWQAGMGPGLAPRTSIHLPQLTRAVTGLQGKARRKKTDSMSGVPLTVAPYYSALARIGSDFARVAEASRVAADSPPALKPGLSRLCRSRDRREARRRRRRRRRRNGNAPPQLPTLPTLPTCVPTYPCPIRTWDFFRLLSLSGRALVVGYTVLLYAGLRRQRARATPCP